MLGSLRPAEPIHGALPFVRKALPSSRNLRTEAEAVVRISKHRAGKRIADVLFGSILAILLLPVVLAAAALIVLTSPGPALYKQVRLGRFGRPFQIWKLRTMVHNCEQGSGARWSTRGDRRVTPVGRVLRRLHIDEFPQLWNVLRGDMSLVGPRPERPEFFPTLSDAISNYDRRLLVKPGVTGVAQVYLPPDEDIPGVRRKQVYDIFYIRSMSLLLDIRLIVGTALQAIAIPHVLVRLLLWLPQPRDIEGPQPILVPVRDALPKSLTSPATMRFLVGEPRTSPTGI